MIMFGQIKHIWGVYDTAKATAGIDQKFIDCT